MAVLYRKYRPQAFGEVIDQTHIVNTLKNQAKAGKFAHAYLFTGSRGVGKTTMARLLAKAANCLNLKDGEPCGKCANCEQIAAGNFLDLVEIDAASNTGVDNIRDLIEHVKFSPSGGKFKVFIIDEVHMLSKGAFNALLKTLEEPPAHAIFILATTEIQKVPATIVSRTQRFDFRRLGVIDLEGHLAAIAKREKIKVPKEVLQLVARHAEGSGRDALSLLDKLLTLGNDITLEDAQTLLGVTDIALSQELLGIVAKGEVREVPGFVERLLERGVDMTVFNRDFLEYLRAALVWKVTDGAVKPELEKEHAQKLEEMVGMLTINDVMFVIRLFLKSFKEISASPSPDVPVLLAGIEATGHKEVSKESGRASAPEKREQSARPPSITSSSNPVSPTLSSRVEQVPNVAKEPAKLYTAAPSETEESSVADAYANVSATLEEVQIAWPSIIEELKNINGPLAHVVRNSHLQGVEGGNVILGVKYAFHKDNLESKKNQEVLRAAMLKKMGKPLRITAVIVKEDPSTQPVASNSLSEALQVFGGELVE